ncbi:MAG: SDR family NAD(P)-dependent oxidoreductase [Calditrichota bacterium]
MSAPAIVPHEPGPPAQRAGVLITGCSSGIGRETALYLSKRGFTVFATVRKASDAESLRQKDLPNLVPTWPLDLTRLDQVSDIVEFVRLELQRRELPGLYAVVNNAGGGGIAPIELLDPEDFRTELETRLVGPVALVQALLPLIRKVEGRLLWIATPALLPIPFVSSIHACDFAANCLARTLHLELQPWNIANILIRCGGIQTPSPERSDRELQENLRHWPQDRVALYRERLEKEREEFADFDRKRTPPEEVARVIHRALLARKPKRKYLVGHLARAAAILEYLPQAWVDFIMAKRG